MGTLHNRELVRKRVGLVRLPNSLTSCNDQRVTLEVSKGSEARNKLNGACAHCEPVIQLLNSTSPIVRVHESSCKRRISTKAEHSVHSTEKKTAKFHSVLHICICVVAFILWNFLLGSRKMVAVSRSLETQQLHRRTNQKKNDRNKDHQKRWSCRSYDRPWKWIIFHMRYLLRSL